MEQLTKAKMKPKQNVLFLNKIQNRKIDVWNLVSTKIQAGYGACYKCPCKAFEGNGQQCENCGHSYSDHW